MSTFEPRSAACQRPDCVHTILQSRGHDSASRPWLSVVVPAYRRPESLVRCLEALCAQTLPRDQFEVIVCDDGSPEPLAPVVAPFTTRLPLLVVTQANAGPAAARNHGARHARGRVLAFTDDDCTPVPDWLERLADRFAREPGNLVGGAIENTLLHDPYATATQLIVSCVYDYYERHGSAQRFYNTSNFAVPADRFWQINGFSELFSSAAGEDYDFCARWHEGGFPSSYAADATVRHAHGHDLGSFCKQHFAYGRALLRVRQGMARRGGRHGVQLEAPRFYGNLLAYPLRQGYGARGWMYAALMFLSQIATAAGAASELLVDRGDW